MSCPSCGAQNDPGSKFCMACGTPLATIVVDGTPPPAPSPEARQDPPPPSAAFGDEPSVPGSTEDVADPLAAVDADAGDDDDDDGSVVEASEEPAADGPAVFEPPTGPDATPAPSAAGQELPPPPPPPAWGTPPPPAAPPPPPAPAWGNPPPPPVAPAWGAPPPPAPSAYPPPPPAASQWGAPAPAAPGYPPAPAPAPPAGAYVPAPPPVAASGPADPNALGTAFGRLGNAGRKLAKVAVLVAGAVLDDGETVEAVVAGRVEGNGAVLVLTDRRLLLVDERQWRPLVERIAVDGGLQVQGWQDDRTASLTLVAAGHQLVIDQIPDRPLAVEMAQRIRYRTGT